MLRLSVRARRAASLGRAAGSGLLVTTRGSIGGKWTTPIMRAMCLTQRRVASLRCPPAPVHARAYVCVFLSLSLSVRLAHRVDAAGPASPTGRGWVALYGVDKRRGCTVLSRVQCTQPRHRCCVGANPQSHRSSVAVSCSKAQEAKCTRIHPPQPEVVPSCLAYCSPCSRVHCVQSRRVHSVEY